MVNKTAIINLFILYPLKLKVFLKEFQVFFKPVLIGLKLLFRTSYNLIFLATLSHCIKTLQPRFSIIYGVKCGVEIVIVYKFISGSCYGLIFTHPAFNITQNFVPYRLILC